MPHSGCVIYLFVAGFLYIKFLSTRAKTNKQNGEMKQSNKHNILPQWTKWSLSTSQSINDTLPARDHVVAEKCAGQQRELWLLHLTLESMEKTLQQQGVHILCKIRVWPGSHPSLSEHDLILLHKKILFSGCINKTLPYGEKNNPTGPQACPATI